MNILELSDKASVESYLPTNEWPVANRIEDINTEQRLLKEEAGQIGSEQNIADSGDTSEEFTLIAGDNTFTRTILNIGIKFIQYRESATADWRWLDYDSRPGHNTFYHLNMRFTADEKEIVVNDARVGFIKVTYERSSTVDFTVADLSLGTIPSPDWLFSEAHDLLWIGPVLAQKIDEERRKILIARYDRIKLLFDNHYERFATQDGEIEAEGGRSNYR